MQLPGLGHCGGVRFRLKFHHPYPFNLCYRSICRRTAIDSELPVPPERTHVLLDSKASWVPINAGPKDKQFPVLPRRVNRRMASARKT
jgi:hypothetical protein